MNRYKPPAKPPLGNGGPPRVKRRTGSILPGDQFADEVAAEFAINGAKSWRSKLHSSPIPHNASGVGKYMWLPTTLIYVLHHLVVLSSIVNVILFPPLLAFEGKYPPAAA